MTNNPFYVATSATKKASAKGSKGVPRKRVPVSPDAHRAASRHKSAARWVWVLCVVAVVLAFV